MYLVFSVGNMKEIFHSVDENKDGRLNPGELQRMLEATRISEKQTSTRARRTDRTQSGRE